MMISSGEARRRLEDIERRFLEGGKAKRKEWRYKDLIGPEIGDDDYIAESMYFDALFDVPNSTW